VFVKQRLRLAGSVFLFGMIMAAANAVAQDKMRMGLSSVSALHSAVWIAEQKGLFRKHGIDAEVIVTGQGGAAGISALLANDIQLVASAGDALSWLQRCKVAIR
jgi:ABC-type nitrate/sulfonate/bicarbonate transport system substrate-binding protein